MLPKNACNVDLCMSMFSRPPQIGHSLLRCRPTAEVLANREKQKQATQEKLRRIKVVNPGRRPDWSSEKLQEVPSFLSYGWPHAFVRTQLVAAGRRA